MIDVNIIEDAPSIVYISANSIIDEIDANYWATKYLRELDVKFDKLNSDGKIDVTENGKLIEDLTDYTANGSFASLSERVEIVDKGIPFIRIKNLSENGLNLNDLKYISEKSYLFLKKSKLEGGELLFSKTGEKLGLAFVFPVNFEKSSLADNIFKVKYKKDLDIYYISIFLNSKYGKLWTKRLSQGVAQPTIIKDRFRRILIPIPSPEIQQYIGDKARLSEKLRVEAEELKASAEQIVYDDLRLNWWENKIENVTNKIDNVDPFLFEERIDAQYYCNNFFKVYEEAKIQKIPFLKLSKLAKLNKGFSNSDDTGQIPFFRISDFDNLTLDLKNVIHINNKIYESKKNCQLTQGDILFAITGATIGKTSIFDNEKILKATLSADTGFARFNSLKLAYFYLLYLQTKVGKAAIKRGETGITNKHLSIDYLLNLELPWNEENRSEEVEIKIKNCIRYTIKSKDLIISATKDIEDLIEGNFRLATPIPVQ